MSRVPDSDKMPFGKHCGVALDKVPVSYLNWYFHEQRGRLPHMDMVMAYIQRNKGALKQEDDDLIWDD